MSKFFTAVLVLMLCFAVRAGAESAPDPKIADIEVKIVRGGVLLLDGSVLLSWKQNVVFDSLREIPMKVKCKPGYEVTGAKTYWDGIRFELGGITRNGRLYSEVGFNVVIPTTEQTHPPSLGCDITFINTRSYKSVSGPILKIGEPARIVVDDLTVELSLDHIYDTAPGGRTLDVFVVKRVP